MNENEVLELNANGAFISPQMVMHLATKWNEKNKSNGIAFQKMSPVQLRKVDNLYMKVEVKRSDVKITKNEQTLGTIPIKTEKEVPDTEIHLFDSHGKLAAKIVGLEK